MRVKPEESKWTVEEKVGVSDTRRRERKKSVKEISTVEGQDTRRSRTDSLTVNEWEYILDGWKYNRRGIDRQLDICNVSFSTSFSNPICCPFILWRFANSWSSVHSSLETPPTASRNVRPPQDNGSIVFGFSNIILLSVPFSSSSRAVVPCPFSLYRSPLRWSFYAGWIHLFTHNWDSERSIAERISLMLYPRIYYPEWGINFVSLSLFSWWSVTTNSEIPAQQNYVTIWIQCARSVGNVFKRQQWAVVVT